MFRAIKYELNPTARQKEQIRQTCGCCRLVYNTMLDRKIKAYKDDKKTLGIFDNGKKREEQSNNWKKAIRQVAKLHEKIANQRNDYLHKVSRWIANTYSTVCVETLNVKGILKNHYLAQAISDCCWGAFINMLGYKCNNLVKIDKWFASSQTCFECGFHNKETKKLSVREWVCPHCGTKHDRDLNAAKNIMREGLSLCGHKVSGSTMLAPRTPLLKLWE